MKKYLTPMICSLLLTGHVAAQMSAEQQAQGNMNSAIVMRAHTVLLEAEARAMEECSMSRLVVPIPAYNFSTKNEEALDAVVSIEWSGACVDGKRDGPGVLTWQSEKPFASGNKLTVTTTAEGRFVKGQRLGMWCVTKYEATLSNRPPSPRLPLSGLGCRLHEGHAKGTPSYIKQPDGRWQEYVLGEPGATFLAAGELEAQSAKLLADAAAGKTDLKARVVMQSRDLDDLLPGSKIVAAMSASPIPLKDKRVAIVLSSQSVSEFGRFKSERQALIDASAGLRGEAAAERSRFIKASNPDRLLVNIAKVMQKHAKDVHPADDLSGLQNGRFDYALVVDWKSMTRFDQLGKYDKAAWPPKPFPAASGVACESLRGFLIGRDLKVVRQLPAFPSCQFDLSTATGDQAYMWILATYFADHWGNGSDELGLSVLGLDAFLKQQ